MSREKDRKFSNVNPEMLSLSEIREIAYKQGRADAIEEIATRLEAELLMVMPRDKVKFIMYKVHTVLEKLKEQK